PGHYCIDAKLPSDSLGILLLSFVLKCGGARHDLQLRRVGKAIDQAFGDAVRQEGGFWSCGRGDVWQEGDGADAGGVCLAMPRSPKERPSKYEDHHPSERERGTDGERQPAAARR